MQIEQKIALKLFRTMSCMDKQKTETVCASSLNSDIGISKTFYVKKFVSENLIEFITGIIGIEPESYFNVGQKLHNSNIHEDSFVVIYPLSALKKIQIQFDKY